LDYFSGGIEQIRGFSSIDYNLIAIINIGIYTTWRFGEEIWLAENDEILIHKLEAWWNIELMSVLNNDDYGWHLFFTWLYS